ncbi:hypothetical protein JYG23_01585 [Sedimentibacter sp. zth1]|uniref:CdaR family protein n=1 Tax=Sedimentibacter sp. zth1 TaxID=2816908 RepID=UPI001A934FA1|nr:CdaR family protein [Sedimentibacter sp. zth1]QSX06183.1 hypothetical protein JYG23_01585 [Sedimentibacter sp. zth1]
MKVKNDKWIVRILCALGAITLWVLVMMKVNPLWKNDFNNIKVNINDLSSLENQGYVLMNEKSDFKVDVKISGLKNNLLKFNSRDIIATIDLNDIRGIDKEGIHHLPVKIQDIENFEITSYSPIYITCNVEKRITKSVGIEVKYEGSQVAGYYVGNGVSNPDSVLVTGPRSVVDSAKSAIAVVNVEGESEILSRSEPVRIVDEKGNELSEVSVKPITVDIALPIYPTKEVPIVVDFVGEPQEGYRVTNLKTELGTVTIAAPKGLLETINEVKTEPVDISGANVDIVVDKNLITDGKIKITDGNHKTKVTATIERIIEKDFEFTFDDIELLNLDENYIVTPIFENEDNQEDSNNGESTDTDEVDNTNLQTPKIKIKVKDIATTIAKISKSNIKLSLDLKDITPGVYELELIIDVDPKAETVASNYQVIKLNVEIKSTEDDSSEDGQE